MSDNEDYYHGIARQHDVDDRLYQLEQRVEELEKLLNKQINADKENCEYYLDGRCDGKTVLEWQGDKACLAFDCLCK